MPEQFNHSVHERWLMAQCYRQMAEEVLRKAQALDGLVPSLTLNEDPEGAGPIPALEWISTADVPHHESVSLAALCGVRRCEHTQRAAVPVPAPPPVQT